MLELRGIFKAIGGQRIIQDVNLFLRRGDMICLAGPSGVGKTTLLEIAAGMIEADGGTVRRHSTRMGCAFQDAPLLPWLSACDNMDFFLSAHMPPEQRRQVSRCWLGKMGLEGAAWKKPSEMSGGMKRRLSIACSLALKPDILMLDEPLAFLDKDCQKAVTGELARLHARRSAAILLISHELELLVEIGASIVEIDSSPLSLFYGQA